MTPRRGPATLPAARKRALTILAVVVALVAACCTAGWLLVLRPMSRFADANWSFGVRLDEALPGAVWTLVPRRPEGGWVLVIGLPEPPTDQRARGAAEAAWRLHAEARWEGSVDVTAVAVGRARTDRPVDTGRHGTSDGWQEHVFPAPALVAATGVAAPPVDAALERLAAAAED